MENVIEVRDVNKFFGEEHVLKDVSHTFEKGKIHGIVGNNGSGKTVLMKCICGFLRPDSGTIFVNLQFGQYWRGSALTRIYTSQWGNIPLVCANGWGLPKRLWRIPVFSF